MGGKWATGGSEKMDDLTSHFPKRKEADQYMINLLKCRDF